MFKYDVLVKKPSHFRNFSGVEVNEFNALNSKIQEKYDAYEQKRLARNNRKRAVGAGHPFKLSLTDRLLMLSFTITCTCPRRCAATYLTSAKPTYSKTSETSSPWYAKSCPYHRNKTARSSGTKPRRDRSSFSRLQSLLGRDRAGDPKTKKQTQAQDTLQRQKEETHRKGPANCERKHLHRPQDSAC